MLETLEKLLEIPTADLKTALSSTADLVAAALRADKVDTFLYDPARDSLVALGTSNQPLSASQKKHGLDILPLSNGGRVVYVYTTGQTFVTGRLLSDPDELRGVKEALRIQSKIGVPLEVGGARRGMMMIASLTADWFTAEDVRFAEIVARWVGLVAHRAQLIEEIAKNAAEQGRRAVAEELITVLAHDLRNYISPVSVRVQLLRRRAERERRDEDCRDLKAAAKGLTRLGALISDILDVARIDQGVFRIDVQPVDIVALLEEAAGALATPDQPVQIRASEEVIVAGDPARIRQCVENLISNAVKHSPKGSKVTVLVSRQPQEGGVELARIEVVDEGPGVPAAILPRIFERFVTGNGGDGGLGLGLYLAKRIAVIHGGDLMVESTSGRGTRFTLTLRCHPD
jgi:signal transduction histidine kinase